MLHWTASDWKKIESSERLLVAYSGGLDSSVLLHSLATQLKAKRLLAVHVNHGIKPQAHQWQLFCQRQAESLDIPFKALSIEETWPERSHVSEQQARQARYQLFTDLIEPGDLLLQAHHASDQAETLLFRLLRGSYGLTAIPRSRALGRGQLLRPLLGHSRADLEEYARQHRLEWVEDESNADTSYDRNYLRHQVMPLLQSRWQQVEKKLSRSADFLTQASELLRQLAEHDLDSCNERLERLGYSIDSGRLSDLTEERQLNLLRYWLRRHNGAFPSRTALEAILNQCKSSFRMQLDSSSLRYFQNKLYWLPPWKPEIDTNIRHPWNLQQPLIINDSIHLKANKILTQTQVTIGFRQGGERCQPLGRQHSQRLKKLFLEYRLEPWLRDCMPIIYEGNDIIAVGDLFRCRQQAPELTLKFSPSPLHPS